MNEEIKKLIEEFYLCCKKVECEFRFLSGKIDPPFAEEIKEQVEDKIKSLVFFSSLLLHNAEKR